MTKDGSTPSDDNGTEPLAGAVPRIVDASHLLGSRREVIITHRGERYRLRITQNGKLLLTK